MKTEKYKGIRVHPYNIRTNQGFNEIQNEKKYIK